MKRLIFILLVALGLQTQAQVNYCDSISYTTLPQQTLAVVGDAPGLVNMVDSITWIWQACNATTCYSGDGETFTFNNILSTDTVKLCYDVYIVTMNTTIACTGCDSLVYNPNSYQWELLPRATQPTAVKEVQLSTHNTGKIYDLLGRELNSIPMGKMYIRNSRLCISK